MTLREALYKSRNIIAIKLGMEIGPQAVIGEAARFGTHHQHSALSLDLHRFSGCDPARDHLRYSAFATLGTRTTPYAIERVEDRAGNTVWAPKPRSETVMDSATRLAHGGWDA